MPEAGAVYRGEQRFSDVIIFIAELLFDTAVGLQSQELKQEEFI